ncbi:MAG: type II toxin-antitoxin system RelE/ParE family toxin [Chloroflexi bacterium]|nr:type II toxin-antitoxin system RelE/ParE family toxin [Chloroflexota bacterium]
MSERAWRLAMTGPAEKQLKRLPPSDQIRVRLALDRLIAPPGGSSGDVKKLQGRSGVWRLRVGNVRVLFERDPDTLTMLVVAVAPRGRAYSG